MYGVTLSNSVCVFDTASGFETIEDAKEWARGRGRGYHVFIENEDIEDGKYPVVMDYWIYNS